VSDSLNSQAETNHQTKPPRELRCPECGCMIRHRPGDIYGCHCGCVIRFADDAKHAEELAAKLRTEGIEAVVDYE
jgi:hypothetical protein